MNKLQKFQVRQRMLFIVMIFSSSISKFLQFVFIVGQAQVIDVVVLQKVNKKLIDWIVKVRKLANTFTRARHNQRVPYRSLSEIMWYLTNIIYYSHNSEDQWTLQYCHENYVSKIKFIFTHIQMVQSPQWGKLFKILYFGLGHIWFLA